MRWQRGLKDTLTPSNPSNGLRVTCLRGLSRVFPLLQDDRVGSMRAELGVTVGKEGVEWMMLRRRLNEIASRCLGAKDTISYSQVIIQLDCSCDQDYMFTALHVRRPALLGGTELIVVGEPFKPGRLRDSRSHRLPRQLFSCSRYSTRTRDRDASRLPQLERKWQRGPSEDESDSNRGPVMRRNVLAS